MDSLLDTLTIEDLPNDVMVHIAETCGLDVAIKLLKHAPGMRIDVPAKPRRDVAKRFIELNYSGHNAQLVARKIGMSESFVFKVLGEKSEMKGARK